MIHSNTLNERRISRPLMALMSATILSACTANPVSTEPVTQTQQVTEPTLAAPTLAERAGAPLFEGMGDFHRPITTSDPDAQKYFDQGMVLAFGFNHAESIRSFRAAQTLDPSCAMCFWGEALATGPNINVTANGKAVMSEDEQAAAFAALSKAVELAPGASEIEQDLITALQARYAAEPVEDRTTLDRAYAKALGRLVTKYPKDNDIGAMYAEAWMNTMPWDYWSDGSTPRPEAVNAINMLEAIIARAPEHPLALHLYIHAVEASANPARAEAAADTLANLVPGSGHLVHMPAHIYWRVGRYHDASEANIRAAKVDEDYIAACNAQGFYPALYYPHNIHFLWAASSMQGRSSVAIEAGEKVAANVRLEMIDQFPTVEFFHTIPLLTLVQFAHWDEILEKPQPRADLSFSNAIWHYARGIALARTGEIEAARVEHDAMMPLMTTEKILYLDGADYPASALLGIAGDLLLGEMALAEGETNAAITHFTSAVASQDALPYTEPPFWYYPTRQSLGVALLKADRAADAEAVYRKDLSDFPNNGWSTFGLIQSLTAQGKTEEAATERARFEKIWAMADVDLEASRL
ncbi:MAG: hypothetical protein CME88_14155 [Hirschia sp.]|nr:hypothetical protein [Hirschia sp.]MBF19516.1 hypothetical protein [Hirschia sp.]